jgi:hypothetical protein
MFPKLPRSLQRIMRSVRKERRPHKSRHAQQPRLWVLEERALLSTLTVTSSADSATDNHTLRYAVLHAQSGDTIQLTAAIKDTIVLTLGELVVNHNVIIESVPARTPTISGDGISRVFEISAGANVTLENVNIIDGNGVADNASGSAGFNGEGGAILNLGSLTVIGSTVSGSSTFVGGGVSNHGSLTVSASTVSGNSAEDAGGVLNFGSLTVSGCTVSGNSAFVGGGVYNLGSLTVSGSTFKNNDAFAFGGGLYNVGHMKVQGSGFTDNSAGFTGGAVSNSGSGTGSITGCSFTGNSAGPGGGGGISVFDGALTIANDTFTDNTTTGSGGGVGVVFGTATVTGCTFTNNTAAVQGGGIANVFGIGTLSVGTSAFSGNTPDAIFGVYTDLGGNTF